jgi:hypothetical protein
MKNLKRVLVADEQLAPGELKEAWVNQDRVEALDAMFRPLLYTVVGSPSEQQAMLRRRPRAGDAAEGYAFFVSQLAYTEAKILPRYYEPMQYTRLLPITGEAGPAATSIRYQIEDQVGQAKWADSQANDTGNADVSWSEKTFNIHGAEVGYMFTQQEIRTTALLKAPLSERRFQASVQAYQRFCNRVGLLGDTPKALTGLLNNAGVTSAVTPSTKNWTGAAGIGGSTAASVAEILTDFAFGMQKVYANSGFNVMPDTVGLPELAWQYLSVTPLNTANSTNITILKFLQENNIYTASTNKPLTILPIFAAATAGASSTGRTTFYVNNEDTLVFHIPMPLAYLAPQLENTKVKVPGEFRLSGVEVKRVTNMYYMDGTT